jgi:hypothetical protein
VEIDDQAHPLGIAPVRTPRLATVEWQPGLSGRCRHLPKASTWLCNVRGAVVMASDEGSTSSLGLIGGSGLVSGVDRGN